MHLVVFFSYVCLILFYYCSEDFDLFGLLLELSSKFEALSLFLFIGQLCSFLCSDYPRMIAELDILKFAL